MIERCLNFACKDPILFHRLIQEAKVKIDFCNNCILKDDCQRSGKKYVKVMRCFDCDEEMECVDTISIIGLDKKVSTLQFFVCWKDKRYRLNMR